ncbi:MAG: hypothetical protein LAT67_00655 [Balneolales bacterium]|nr:hypothetical protein [Balneolales bacterium]
MKLFSTLKGIVRRLKTHPRKDYWQKIVKKTGVLLILGLIFYQLTQIGWAEVLQSLPVQPLFYILFLMLYISLPVAELFIYRQIWPIKRIPLLKAFLTKRVYNEEVMGYSGEVYLTVWAKGETGKKASELARNVRDTNILSAVCSYTMVFILAILLITQDIIPLNQIISAGNSTVWLAGILVIITLLGTGLYFRKYFFALPAATASKIFGIYSFRFALHHALLVLQWAVVIPETPLSTWLIYLALIIVVNRLPFIPSKDLVFAWAGIGLADTLGVPAAAVAAMLLVSSALNKSLNFGLYLLVSSWKTKVKAIGKEDMSKDLID